MEYRHLKVTPIRGKQQQNPLPDNKRGKKYWPYSLVEQNIQNA